MKRLSRLVLLSVVTLVPTLAACGGTNTGEDIPEGADIHFGDYGSENDLAAGDAAGEVTSDAITGDADTSEVVPDTVIDTGSDAGQDAHIPDTTPADNGSDKVEPVDEGQDLPPVVNFCNSMKDCESFEVCDLATGICEERSSYKLIVGNEDLFQFKPAAGQYGDFIILDGTRFLTNPTTTAVRADIDKTLIAGSSVLHSTVSAHRIVGVVPNKGGEVGVVFQQATPVYQKYPDPFTYTTTNVMACDGSTPAATGTAGGLGDVGPHAAGYVDFPADDVRVYYPAQCGSVRRPGIPGTYPVLIIVPEGQDTNFPFLNFDYLGQMLATWGIVTISLDAKLVEDDPQGHPKKLFATAPKYLNADLGLLHSAMTGVLTGSTFAWMAFGSGADTLNLLKDVDKESTIYNKAVATIAMAPSFKMNKNGSQYFMALLGPLDGIANNSYANDSYSTFDSPKWKVQVVGGNHSLFTDHQMYYGGGMMPIMDGEPEIMRKEQLFLSISMILPFLQLAFGLDQPFEDQVRTGFSDGKLVVSKG